MYAIGKTLGDGAVQILDGNGNVIAKTHYYLPKGEAERIAQKIVDGLNFLEARND